MRNVVKVLLALAVAGAAVVVTPTSSLAECTFCDTAQPSGQRVCNFGPIGHNLCTMNLGTCWVSGGLCGQGEIESVVRPGGKRPQPMTLAYRAAHADLALSEREVQEVIDECNRSPGCRWFASGRDGGYGHTWGRLKITYR